MRASTNRSACALLLLGASALVAATPAASLSQEVKAGSKGSATPAHPRDIAYPPLAFAPPTRDDHRLQLPNGLRIYFVAERSVPTISVEAWFTAGEVYLSKEKRGLAKLAGELMRTGGVEGLDARALDRRLDALASSIDVEIGAEEGHASLWTLSKNADETLALFAKVLRAPSFSEDRIRRAKDELKDEIEHRDDEPDAVLSQKVRETIFGDGAFSWRETVETVDAITQDELKDFHRAALVPNNLILAVSGDFDRAAMTKRLEALFGDWKAMPVPFQAPVTEQRARPGVFLLDRPVNQGFVEIVLKGPQQGHADEIPLQVMNFILGGGSFTSRITAHVRNDHGLAYSAGSFLRLGDVTPGTLGAYFQSKAESTAFATKLCMDDIALIRKELVGPDELARAKASFKDRFPERFATAAGAAGALAKSEHDNRPPDWFATFRAKVDAVTDEDVLRVARAHLVPENLSVVVVGPKDVVLAKDEKNAASLASYAKGGAVEELK